MLHLKINSESLDAMINYGFRQYEGEEWGITIADNTCCGGVHQVEILKLQDINKNLLYELVFTKSYKDYQLNFYMYPSQLSEIPEECKIELISQDPPIFEFIYD